MIALYIILGVFLLLFLITLIPVEVLASYTDTLTLTVKVLFYKKKLLPSPPKPKPEKKPEDKPGKKEEDSKKDKKEKKSYLTKLREKKGLGGLISLFTSLAKIAAGALKGIFAHTVIHKLNVGIALSSGDAASTAVNYGRVCSALYPAVDIIVNSTVCKNYNVTVEPVFDDEKDTEIYAELHAHLRIIFALIEAVKAGVKLLIVRIKL